MSGVKAVISDFGGVLTSPLVDSFLAFQESSGISLAELGKAMAELAARHGANPLFELETGRLTETDFLSQIGAQLSQQLGLSRTPVRQAFVQLEAEGLLELYPKRGALVVPVAAVAQTSNGPEVGYVAVPLWGQGDAVVKTRPRARIEVSIGDRTFGPVKADGTGIALVPVVVATSQAASLKKLPVPFALSA